MFYNLGAGGDGTNNPNWAIYPQNALIIGEDNSVLVGGSTPLRPAEHMSPATYNIWRQVNFGHEQFPTNLGVRELIKHLVDRNTPFAADDVIGLSTIPHLAIVRGVMLQVNAAQPGTVFNVIRASTGEVLIANIDASETGVHFVETSGFVVRPDTNDSIAIQLVSWPEVDTSNVDPCGVFGPCDDYSLCLTVNAFIWSPVAADFCVSDPCFGAKPYKPYVAGNVVEDRPTLEAGELEMANVPSAANSSAVLEGNTVVAHVEDSAGHTVSGAALHFSGTGTVAITGAAVRNTDADGNVTVEFTPGETGGTVVVRIGGPSGQVIDTLTVTV